MRKIRKNPAFPGCEQLPKRLESVYNRLETVRDDTADIGRQAQKTAQSMPEEAYLQSADAFSTERFNKIGSAVQQAMTTTHKAIVAMEDACERRSLPEIRWNRGFLQDRRQMLSEAGISDPIYVRFEWKELPAEARASIERFYGVSSNPPALRIVIGGEPHSGKSTFMSMLRDRLCTYGVDVDIVDLDLSSPTICYLYKGADRARCKQIWTTQLASTAKQKFQAAEGDVILGDSVGKITDITRILAEPANAVIILSRNGGAIERWSKFYQDIEKPIIAIVESEMGCSSVYNARTQRGTICNLDRERFLRGELTFDPVIEGISKTLIEQYDLKPTFQMCRKAVAPMPEANPHRNPAITIYEHGSISLRAVRTIDGDGWHIEFYVGAQQIYQMRIGDRDIETMLKLMPKPKGTQMLIPMPKYDPDIRIIATRQDCGSGPGWIIQEEKRVHVSFGAGSKWETVRLGTHAKEFCFDEEMLGMLTLDDTKAAGAALFAAPKKRVTKGPRPYTLDLTSKDRAWAKMRVDTMTIQGLEKRLDKTFDPIKLKATADELWAKAAVSGAGIRPAYTALAQRYFEKLEQQGYDSSGKMITEASP